MSAINSGRTGIGEFLSKLQYHKCSFALLVSKKLFICEFVLEVFLFLVIIVL